MTEPFVGRCSEAISSCSDGSVLELEILSEIFEAKAKDVELLVDLVKDTKSGEIFRACALDRIFGFYHEKVNSVREILLALIDPVLTYDENGQPLEKSEELRRIAFECICSIYTPDDVEGYTKWKTRVANDPSAAIRWLASLSHDQ